VPDAHERFLRDVVRIGGAAGARLREAQRPAHVARHEDTQGALVARRDLRQEVFIACPVKHRTVTERDACGHLQACEPSRSSSKSPIDRAAQRVAVELVVAVGERHRPHGLRAE